MISRQPVIASREGTRFRILMWIFCLSFMFDFRGEKGGPPFQLIFLGIALASGSLAVMMSLRHVRVRPGIYLILLWWGYLASTVAVALLGDADPERFARVVIPYGLLGLGLLVTHVAAVRGIRVQEIVGAILLAVIVNVVWRAAFGAVFHGVTLETVRVEILSPGINWMMAYIGVGLLLRDRMSPVVFLMIGLAGTLVFLSVTRGTLLPPVASAVATSLCLVLAVRWKIIPTRWAAGKVMTLCLVTACVAAILGTAALTQRTVLERWEDRLFHHGRDVTSTDVSLLTRQAEAVGIWKSLTEVPLRVLYGKGMGASYYWEASFFPELYLIYGEDENFDGEIWFAGHSTWTFALFSGGVIGLVCCLGMLLGVMGLSLRSAWRNRQFPGFRVDLAFLPFVAACCLLSESITSNPFDERMAGLVFGVMAGLPQFFFNRAYALRRARQSVNAQIWVEQAVAAPAAQAVSPFLPGRVPGRGSQGRRSAPGAFTP